MTDDNDKVQVVLEVLLRLASADLDARVPASTGNAPLDLVAAAVNMLAEELSAVMAAEAKLRVDLEQEVRQRQAEVEALARAQELVARQNEAIRALSTPVMEVWAGILVLPLIGLIDQARGEQLMDQLLSAIVRTGAQVAILDITGVPEVDTSVADQLQRAMAAAKLLGTQTIMTGVSPENAQTMVRLDIDLSQVHAERSLAAGLRRALLLMHARAR